MTPSSRIAVVGDATATEPTPPRSDGATAALPERLGVLPWPSGTDSPAVTHDPRSAYVETFWLPVIGPSSTLLLRRLADEFESAPEGFELDCLTTSREIGLAPRLGRRAPFVRTLERCERFGLLRLDGAVLYVQPRLPPVGPAQLRRLPERLQLLHTSWTLPDDDAAIRRRELNRAVQLSRTLMELDEADHEIERQLHQWHFHPSIAWHAVQLARAGGLDAV